MPSANTGKQKIKAIKIFKDHVTITFLKREPLKISKEAFLSSYLYANKSISQKEIDKLIEITSLTTLLNYAISLTNKRRYSERSMREKLYKKEEANKSSVDYVIAKLKETHLIDDKTYMNDLVAYYEERKYGKNKIISHLKNQGLSDELIAQVKFSTSKETKKAKTLIEKLSYKYRKYNYESKKQHIYQALVNRGYSFDAIKEALNDVKKDNPKQEKEKLVKDYQKALVKYQNKYDGYQLKQKIYAYLVNKGYHHNEIKTVLEDMYDENDCGLYC